jgi:hypothetical protein
MKFLEDKEIVKIVPAKRLGQSLEFLKSRRADLQHHESLEDFIEALISEAPKTSTLSGLEFHIAAVRNEVLRELRRRGVFIGQSIVEELAFYVLRDGDDSNPAHQVLDRVREAGLYHPGLLVFALRGVGILGFGAFRALGRGDTT